MSKHIKLTVGVDVPASAEHFRRDLQAVLASAGADPLKVKIAIDENSIASAMQRMKKFANSINMMSTGSDKGTNVDSRAVAMESALDSVDAKAQNVAKNVSSSFNSMASSVSSAIAASTTSLRDQLDTALNEARSMLSLPMPNIPSNILIPEHAEFSPYSLELDGLAGIVEDYQTLNKSLDGTKDRILALPPISEKIVTDDGLEWVLGVNDALIRFKDQWILFKDEVQGTDFDFVDDEDVSDMQQASLAIEQTAQSLRSLGSDTGNIENISESIDNASESINKMGAATTSTQYKVENLARAVQGFDNEWFSSDGLKFNDDDNGAKLARYDQRLKEYQERIKNISFDYENGKMVAKRGDTYLEQKEIDELISRYNELNTLRRVGVRNQSNSNKSAASIEREREALQNLNVELSRYIAENKGLMKPSQLDAFNKLYNSTKTGAIGLKEAKDAFARLKTEVNDSTNVVQKFFNQFKTSIISRLSTGAITAAFAALRKAVHEVYQNVIQLDKAITDLQIATGYSRQQTAGLVQEYSKLGNELGATTVEVAQAADEWLRQGYSAQEAGKLIESSMMLSKLGQISASEATTALTSAINGYKMSSEDAVSIVDKLTAVDMEAAASAGGLATAMSKTATSAMTAGVSMDTLIGYIAKVKEVTQDGDEAVGTFFKTMLARMGNIKSGLLVDPETDENLGDVEAALSGVGIKLRDTENHFRDLESVLNEVSQQWGNYSNVQQRAIAKAFAGTRQQEKFLVLMENYDDAMRLAGVSADSSGTAIQKYNDAYLKSYEAAKNSLSASTEAFSQSVLDTDIVIGAVNALNMLVQALTKLNETGAVAPLAGIGAVFAVMVKRTHDLVSAFNVVQGTVNPVISTLSNINKGSQDYAKAVTQITGAIAGENKAIQEKVVLMVAEKDEGAAIAVLTQLNAAAEEKDAEATTKSTIAMAAKIMGLEKKDAALIQSIIAEKAAAVASGDLTEAELAEALVGTGLVTKKQAQSLAHIACAGAKKTEKVATDQLTMSQKLLNAVGGPTTIIIAAIAAAVIGLAFAFKKLSSAENEARADLEDMRSDLNATENEISSVSSQLEQNKQRLEELNDVEHPTFATEAEIAKLEETNQKLETQLALLKAREKYQKGQISEQEEKVWNKANGTGVGSTVWADDGSGKIWKAAQWTADAEMQSHFLSTADAVDVYIQKMNEAQDKLEAYQQTALENGEIDDEEQEKLDELSAEVQKYEGNLLEMADILEDTGDKGQAFVDKIAYATTDAAGRWGMMKNDLDEVRKRIDANDLKGLNADNISTQLDPKRIQSYAQAIKEAGKDNELFNSITKDMTDEQIIVWFAELIGAADDYKDAIDDATDKNYDFADSLQAIGDAQSGIKSIQKAFQDMQDDGKVSFSTINDISKALKDVGVDDADIEQWSNTLLKSTSNSAKFKAALSEMTYAYVRGKIGVDNMTESHKDAIVAMLDEAGVANSVATADNMIAQAAAEAAIKNAAATGSAEAITAALGNEAGQAALTNESFVRLVAEMIVFNNTNLDVSQKLEALRTLAAQAGITGSAIAAALDGGNIMGEAVNEYAKTYGIDTRGRDESYKQTDEFKAIYNRIAMEHFNNMMGENQPAPGSVPGVIYNGSSGGGSSGGGGGGSSSSALDNYTKSVDRQVKKTELSYKRGEMSAKDYFKAMEIIYKDGYDGLQKAIANGEFSDSDEDEILDAELGMLDKLQGAHRDSYEEEKKLQDHYLKMNYITEEQYFAELTRLYLTYYAGREEYSEEAQQAEEELYEKGTAIVEKWANAAVDAVNAVSDAMQSMASAATDLLQGLIDANEHSFDRYYKNLQHQLKMNYITEAEYTDQLDKLYKRYFRDRYIYLDQYQQYEEEVYQAEQQALQDAASATEDIHGKVVDMIRDELEEQKDAIDETKDAYLELIDIRRQALEDQKDQEDYEKEHAEKLAAVAELQRQLNALANDNSAEGVRKYKETLNSLHDAQEELYDFEREHAYDSLEKQLDEQEAALENSSETTKTEIDKKLEDNEWLVAEAWRRMQGMSDELYNQLIAHNKKYSTSIKDDITDAWDKAREAMQRYYDGVNAEGGYAHITGRIGESGMTDAEAMQDNVTAGIKNVAEYTSVFVKAIAAFASAGASLVSSFASILNQVFPNPLTSLMATGAGGMASAVSGFGGMATNLFGFLGGLAGGSDSVSATGIYRTDEFGEELKMLRTADGNYTMLTKGSKVFTARATERLAKILEHPELLTGGLVPDIVSSISGSMAPAPSMVDASSQNITLSQSFNISGANPDEIANKIKGTIADYTLDVIRKNSRDSGRVRPVRSVY